MPLALSVPCRSRDDSPVGIADAIDSLSLHPIDD